MRRISLLGLAACCALLAACNEDIYTNLSERDANTVVTALGQDGIAAQKTTNGKTWSVNVKQAQALRAMKVLRNRGLPAEHYADLGELFKPQGLVSTPTEERMRYVYGISQQLARSLKTIDGVLAADVHIVIPVNDPISDQKKPPRAGVFIKFNSDVDLAPLAPMIKELVAHSVEGISENDVSLTLVPAIQQATALDRMPGETVVDSNSLAWGGAGVVLGAIVGALLHFLRAAGGLRGALQDLRLGWHVHTSARRNIARTP